MAMSDWESLISEVSSETPTAKPVVHKVEEEESNEFGDVLRRAMLLRTENALKAAEVNPLKIKPEEPKPKDDTSGADWFNMPRTELTDDQRRDWETLKLRNVFSKGATNMAKLSENPSPYVQFATVKENKFEGRGERLTRKERAMTITEEIAKDQSVVDYIEKAYSKIEKPKRR